MAKKSADADVLDDMIDPEDQYEVKEEPPQEAPVETPPEQPDERVPETPDDAESQETEDTVDPYQQLFTEQGLDKTYKGVDDMIRRVPYLNKFVTETSQENARLAKEIEEYRQRQAQLEQQTRAQQTDEYDPDKFYQDPYSSLDQRYVTREQLQQIEGKLQQQEMARMQERFDRFAAEHEDFASMSPMMERIAREDPGFLQLRDPLSALYHEAKRRFGPQQEAVKKAAQESYSASRDAAKKRASTSGTGSKPQARTVTPEDLYKMPIEELEKRLRNPADEEYEEWF